MLQAVAKERDRGCGVVSTQHLHVWRGLSADREPCAPLLDQVRLWSRQQRRLCQVPAWAKSDTGRLQQSHASALRQTLRRTAAGAPCRVQQTVMEREISLQLRRGRDTTTLRALSSVFRRSSQQGIWSDRISRRFSSARTRVVPANSAHHHNVSVLWCARSDHVRSLFWTAVKRLTNSAATKSSIRKILI